MDQTNMESRIAVLEEEISTLKIKFEKIENADAWWKQRSGIFADDPLHAEATRLGREWRQSNGSNGDAHK
ncbi:MAG: hypothetical protein HOP17_05240 [Acidobacteria bacterium]|nr:hypothetical protein [Acidobacteriota bacterium]